MSVKKIIPLLLFLSSLGVLFVYGFSKKVSTFGIEGTLVFEADNAAGTTVIYTTGTQSPLIKTSDCLSMRSSFRMAHFFLY